jgi:arginase family enzyme
MVTELKSHHWSNNTIGNSIEVYNTDLLILDVAPKTVFLSVGDMSDDNFIKEIRQKLYQLYLPKNSLQIADIGHFSENIDLLPEAIARIRKYGSIPIIISPDQSTTYSIYLAYCKLEVTVNILSVDDKIDLEEEGNYIGDNNWLSYILAFTPNYLFNYSILANQSYLCNPHMQDMLQSLNFDIHRLGNLRNSIQNTEPIFRNADIVSFDLSSIRNSDCPDSLRHEPNGLYAEEACQLMRYAGLSNKVSCAGFFGWDYLQTNPNSSSISLIAQLIWHFLDGVVNRIDDGKIGDEDDYMVYKIGSDDISTDLVFYKNIKNGRWWMNVPMNELKKGKFDRHHVIPCSIDDYKQAMNGEIPDTWWQTFQKLL